MCSNLHIIYRKPLAALAGISSSRPNYVLMEMLPIFLPVGSTVLVMTGYIHKHLLPCLREVDSYEDLFAVIRRLNLPYLDSRQQYLRMVFNIQYDTELNIDQQLIDRIESDFVSI